MLYDGSSNDIGIRGEWEGGGGERRRREGGGHYTPQNCKRREKRIHRQRLHTFSNDPVPSPLPPGCHEDKPQIRMRKKTHLLLIYIIDSGVETLSSASKNNVGMSKQTVFHSKKISTSKNNENMQL